MLKSQMTSTDDILNTLSEVILERYSTYVRCHEEYQETNSSESMNKVAESAAELIHVIDVLIGKRQYVGYMGQLPEYIVVAEALLLTDMPVQMRVNTALFSYYVKVLKWNVSDVLAKVFTV